MAANSYIAPGQTGCDDSVLIEEYDPAWQGAFAELSDWLRARIGPDIALRIEHIGSTSIPGMPAKPVIDVLVEVPSYAAARERALPALNQEAWEYWWYQEHMTFVRREQFLGRRTHHVHMMIDGDELHRRLAFRDYLCSHAAEASRYADLKRRLARSHSVDREAYTDAKTTYVTEVVAKAMGIPDGTPPPDAPGPHH